MGTTRGFTLVELVIVMVLVAALAVVALPRMLDTQLWQLRAFGDDMLAQLLAHQQMALQQRRTVVVTISGNGLLFSDSGGHVLTQLDCPARLSPCIAETGARTVRFNHAASGQTLTQTGAALDITVSASGYAQGYRIENDTGLAHALP